MRHVKNLFFFWLILTPFVVWRGYEGEKVIWFLSGGFGLCLFWLWRLVFLKIKIQFTKADYFFLVWLFVLLLSSWLGVHPLDSILGGSYRHQGVLFFFAFWLITKTLTLLSNPEKQFIRKCLAGAVLVEAGIVIIQVILGKVYFGRPLGTFGEENAVAGFLGVGFCFLNSGLLSFVIIATAVILTSSRIGLGMFVFLFLAKFLKLKKLALVLLAVVFLLYAILDLAPAFKTFIGPKTLLWHFDQENRVLIWRMAVDKIRQRPLLGWGAESGELVFDAAYREAGMPLENMMVDRAHNLFLDVVLWSGLVGLVPFLVWLRLVFKKRPVEVAGWLGFACFQPLGVVHWLFLIWLTQL